MSLKRLLPTTGILLLLFHLPFLSVAQYGELGIAGGVTNYNGDVSAPYDLKQLDELSIGLVRPALGIFGRYNSSRFLSFRGHFMYGVAAGSDQENTGFSRNLSFETDIYELGAAIEFNLFGYDPVGSGKWFSPYLLLGGAGYYFNPTTIYNGRKVDLQPLGTEGQGIPGFDEKYSRIAVAIPVGLGFKFGINGEWTIGVELVGRKLFNDYLDDVSGDYADYHTLINGNGTQAAALANREWEISGTSPAAVISTGSRGNDKFVDWYYMTILTISRHLGVSKAAMQRKGNGRGCPTF